MIAIIADVIEVAQAAQLNAQSAVLKEGSVLAYLMIIYRHLIVVDSTQTLMSVKETNN